MNRQEHLLTILAEESVEVAQRCSKALRFGLSEIQPGQHKTNAKRILSEYFDSVAVMRMLIDEGLISFDHAEMEAAVEAKKDKVEAFMAYSFKCGTLTVESQK